MKSDHCIATEFPAPTAATNRGEKSQGHESEKNRDANQLNTKSPRHCAQVHGALERRPSSARQWLSGTMPESCLLASAVASAAGDLVVDCSLTSMVAHLSVLPHSSGLALSLVLADFPPAHLHSSVLAAALISEERPTNLSCSRFFQDFPPAHSHSSGLAYSSGLASDLISQQRLGSVPIFRWSELLLP